MTLSCLRERVQNSDDALILAVRKGSWPKQHDCVSVVETPVEVNVARGELSVGVKLHTYSLQHAALQSADVESGPHTTNDWALAIDGLEINLVRFWRGRFESELARLIENRQLTNYDPVPLWGHLPVLLLGARTSLFGKRVLRYKSVDSSNGFKVELNPKYYRCPHQVMDFHPDIAEFLFLDVEEWAGKLTYIEQRRAEHEFRTRAFIRVVLTTATKPLRTDLGRVTTVLPKGFKGLLYRVVWKLLRINP